MEQKFLELDFSQPASTPEEPETLDVFFPPNKKPKRRRKKNLKVESLKLEETKADLPVKAGSPLERKIAPDQKETPPVFTITEITHQIRDRLEETFADVWVVGEVSNFRNPSAKHYYFTLKDELSQLNAVIFSGGTKKLPFTLEDGLELICHGRISVYGARGQYQIIVDHCEPKGKGALQVAFEQLKKKLADEGLFNKEYKKPLPYLPRKIGVVTSPTGAAIRDIINVLTRRFSGIEILLRPALVQGEEAAADIAAAIFELNQRTDIDLLIVGRGGGSLEDLWAFNEEVVARAIFASKIPIISAVGHEIDFTIADFVADVRAPTPSAAAEIAVPVKVELLRGLADRRNRLLHLIKQILQNRWSEVQQLRAHIPDLTRRLPELLMRVDSLNERLQFSLKVYMEQRTDELKNVIRNLNLLSPLQILEKGYAVVQKKGDPRSIKSPAELKAGDELNLRLHQGLAEAKVIKSRP